MKKMNKKFLAGTAFAISTASALTLTGCCLPRFLPTPNVYGPPEYFEKQVETTSEITEPSPTVYGPPEYFESQEETTAVFEPEPPVYGPPEYWEPQVEIENDFSEEDEILEDVYGPPEWFE